MPFGDRTGPEGKGAQTGRGLGNCNTNDSDNSNDSNVNNAGVAGFLGRGFRNAISRGNGSGRGNGRGRNRR